MKASYLTILITLGIGTIAASQSVFTVDQKQRAIVLQLGQPRGEPREPGLHFKMPFIQNVRYFDSRILSIDPGAEPVVISSDHVERQNQNQNQNESGEGAANDAQIDTGPSIESVSGEPIIVDTFARYKITDPLQFMKTLRTITNANARIESILNGSTRAVLGETTLAEILSEERTQIMSKIRARVNEKITEDRFGIELVDVRIVRADLTDELRASTVRQMRSQLNERATERRSKGEERALEIRSTAEKERTIILAEAMRDAEIIKGQGDKEAIKIYADAFNVDQDFYSFIRSMEAYKKTMANPETRLILSPDSAFFKHFKETVN
ncbi:MAG: protease modulator HflC [Alphaproteobacteria bacterium]